MRYLVVLMLSFCSLIADGAGLNEHQYVMQSADKQLSAMLYLKNGQLSYSISAQGNIILERSVLGIEINRLSYGSGVKKVSLNSHSIQQVRGAKTYEFEIWDGTESWNLQFALFGNGCAFRYLFKDKTNKTVNKEKTGFDIPEYSKIWFFERDNDWKLKSYAGLWLCTGIDSLKTISKMGPIQGKPLIIALPGKQYMLLTEAALYNYSGMRFEAMGNRKLQVNFTEGEKGFTINGPLITPWRVVLFASDLNQLVNNQVIQALNPKPDPLLFNHTGYIKPGRSVWSWITKNADYMKPSLEMEFIKAASSLNFEYSLIDEGWETSWKNKWRQLKELCDFAAKKKVKIWVWKHSNGLRDASQRDAFLDSLVQCGVAGLKTDFMNSEAKDLIDFEIGLLKATAKRQLMVDFHGCQAPTGESTTYPNEMTREGIRGMELNTMHEPIPAWHNAALPFTRFVIGHGDYTPGLFSNKGNTSYTHQLSLLYLFDSPFQCIAESPVTLLNDQRYQPILPFLRELPVTWDETIVLPGSSIGQLAAFARRKGNSWYVSVINGSTNAADFLLTSSFLKHGKAYQASIISDQPDGSGFLSYSKGIESGEKLNFKLLPAGGLLIKILAKEEKPKNYE